MKYRIDFRKVATRTVEADNENEAIEKALHDLNQLNNIESCWYEDDIESLEELDN